MVKKILAIVLCLSLFPPETWSLSFAPRTSLGHSSATAFGSQALLLSVESQEKPLHAQSSARFRKTITSARHVSAATANRLGAFVRREWWTPRAQILWIIGSAFAEETILRRWWVGDPHVFIDGCFDDLLPGLAGTVGVMAGSALLHPLAKGLARTALQLIPPWSRAFWKTLGSTLRGEVRVTRQHFSRSALFASILFTSVYVDVAATSTPAVGLLVVGLFHVIYDVFIAPASAHDPFLHQARGRKVQLDLLEMIAGHFKDQRWDTSYATVGAFDHFADHPGLRALIDPMATENVSDVLASNQELFPEMREQLKAAFQNQDIVLYRGSNDMTFEPHLRGTPTLIGQSLRHATADYVEAFIGRYAFYDLAAHGTSESIKWRLKRLKKFPGLVALSRYGDAGRNDSDGYTLVIDRKAYLQKHQDVSSLRTALAPFFDASLEGREIQLQTADRSLFTASVASLSWRNVLDKALASPGGRAFWIEKGREGLRLDRLEAFYDYGMALAQEVLEQAKQEGPDRVVVAGAEEVRRLPWPAAALSPDEALVSSEQIFRNHQNLVSTVMDREALEHYFAQHLTDSVYRFSFLNQVSETTVPDTGAGDPHAQAVAWTELFSEVLPHLFPPGTFLAIAPTRDGFLVSSAAKLDSPEEVPFGYLQRTLRRHLLEKRGGALTEGDVVFLRSFKPIAIVYRTSLADIRAVPLGRDSLLDGTLTPFHILDAMAAAGFRAGPATSSTSMGSGFAVRTGDGIAGWIDRDRLQSVFNVQLKHRTNSIFVSLDGQRSATLPTFHRRTQFLEREENTAILSQLLQGRTCSIDELPTAVVNSKSDRSWIFHSIRDMANAFWNLRSTWDSSPFAHLKKIAPVSPVFKPWPIDLMEARKEMSQSMEPEHLNASNVRRALENLVTLAVHPNRYLIGDHAVSLLEQHAVSVISRIQKGYVAAPSLGYGRFETVHAYLLMAPEAMAILAQPAMSRDDAQWLIGYGRALLEKAEMLRVQIRVSPGLAKEKWSHYWPVFRQLFLIALIGTLLGVACSNSPVAMASSGIIMMPLLNKWRTKKSERTSPALTLYGDFLEDEFAAADAVPTFSSATPLSDFRRVLEQMDRVLRPLKDIITDHETSMATFRESLEEQMLRGYFAPIQIGMVNLPLLALKDFGDHVHDGEFVDRFQGYLVKEMAREGVASYRGIPGLALENGRLFVVGMSPADFRRTVAHAMGAAIQDWIKERGNAPRVIRRRTDASSRLYQLTLGFAHTTIRVSEMTPIPQASMPFFYYRSPEAMALFSPEQKRDYLNQWWTYREASLADQYARFAQAQGKRDLAGAASAAEAIVVTTIENLSGAAQILKDGNAAVLELMAHYSGPVSDLSFRFPMFTRVLDDTTFKKIRDAIRGDADERKRSENERNWLDAFYQGVSTTVPPYRYEGGHLPRRARFIQQLNDQVLALKMAVNLRERQSGTLSVNSQEMFVRDFQTRFAEINRQFLLAAALAPRNPRQDEVYNVRWIDTVLNANDRRLLSTLRDRLLAAAEALPAVSPSSGKHQDEESQRTERQRLALNRAAGLLSSRFWVYARPSGDEMGVATVRDSGGYHTGFLELTNLFASYLRFPPDARDERLHAIRQMVVSVIESDPSRSLVLAFEDMVERLHRHSKDTFPLRPKVPTVTEQPTVAGQDTQKVKESKRLTLVEFKDKSGTMQKFALGQQSFKRVSSRWPLLDRWVLIDSLQAPHPVEASLVQGSVGATGLVNRWPRMTGQMVKDFSKNEALAILQKKISDWSERVRYDTTVIAASAFLRSPPVRLWIGLSDKVIRYRLPILRTTVFTILAVGRFFPSASFGSRSRPPLLVRYPSTRSAA